MQRCSDEGVVRVLALGLGLHPGGRGFLIHGVGCARTKRSARAGINEPWLLLWSKSFLMCAPHRAIVETASGVMSQEDVQALYGRVAHV
jgi:hypothetical protein